jgi:phage FluMu protein Com
MKSTTKVLATTIITLILLILIGVFIAKEGSIFLFLIRLAVGLTLITGFMSAMLGGIPNLLSEKCPKCKSLNSFSKVEEIIDNRVHTIYKKCRSCGYKKPYK